MEKDFEVKQEGSALTVTLGNKLYAVNSPALMEELVPYTDQGIEKVVFDATNLTLLSSSGVRVIMYCKQKLGASPESVFVNCKEEVLEVLGLVGIRSIITFEKR